MMNLVPWSSKNKEETALVPVEEERGLTTTKGDDEIVIYQGNRALGKPRGGAVVQVRPKALKIAGKTYNVDPHQLVRMIKQVTQTIGEYKDKENPYAGYVVGALRKARADMVSDLEHHFGIHWEIDEASGKSIFYM